MTGVWIPACATAGIVLGATASILTRHNLTHPTASVLASWWFGAIMTALALTTLSWRVDTRGELVVYTIVVALGVPLAVIDALERRLPRLLVWAMLAGAATGLGTLCLFRHDIGPGLRATLAMLALTGTFLLLALLVPSGVGAGDVRLATVIGLVSGWSSWPTVTSTMAIALVLALIIAIPITLRQRGTDRAAEVPFGPCLLVGLLTAVALASGQPRINPASAITTGPIDAHNVQLQSSTNLNSQRVVCLHVEPSNGWCGGRGWARPDTRHTEPAREQGPSRAPGAPRPQRATGNARRHTDAPAGHFNGGAENDQSEW
jgi:leader peptidase (prepilin peptidase)/N-methyltransferase